jgi:hypothetical protein
VNVDDLIESNFDSLCTTTAIKKSTEPNFLVDLLKARKTTGELRISFRNGGIRSIQLHEQTEATENQRDGLRKIFGMP